MSSGCPIVARVGGVSFSSDEPHKLSRTHSASQVTIREANRMTHSCHVLTSTRMPPTTVHDKNKLYYGDNLQVLREYIPDKSVDLIYLDSPFNSRQDYNVLFAEKDGTRSASQITAFKDTWEWNEEAARSYEGHRTRRPRSRRHARLPHPPRRLRVPHSYGLIVQFHRMSGDSRRSAGRTAFHNQQPQREDVSVIASLAKWDVNCPHTTMVYFQKRECNG
jgi:hypothetical protein